MITQYCNVRLKNGSCATIIEIFNEDNFLAEIWTDEVAGDLESIHRSDIKALITEIEVPLDKAV